MVAGGVATATVAAGHGYRDKRIVEVSGAAEGAVNGRKRTTVTGTSTYTFPAPGVADGAVGGTITSRRATGLGSTAVVGQRQHYARTDPPGHVNGAAR